MHFWRLSAADKCILENYYLRGLELQSLQQHLLNHLLTVIIGMGIGIIQVLLSDIYKVLSTKDQTVNAAWNSLNLTVPRLKYVFAWNKASVFL